MNKKKLDSALLTRTNNCEGAKFIAGVINFPMRSEKLQFSDNFKSGIGALGQHINFDKVMVSFYSNIRSIICILLILHFSKLQAQSETVPYYQHINKINEQIENGKLDDACNSFMTLERGHHLLGPDVITVLQITVKCNHYRAFETCIKWLHHNSYEPISESVYTFLNEDTAILKKDSKFQGIYSRVIKTKPDFSHLDHESILFLNGLISSDYDDRIINLDTLESNKSKRIAHSDSVRFSRFVEFVQKKGFPKWSSLGIYAGGMQTLLYHWTFLGMREYEGDSKLFQQKLYLAQMIHQRVKEGEFSYGFYNNQIIGLTKWILTKSNRKNDFVFFEPYTVF